jgi:hypothetical protein
MKRPYLDKTYEPETTVDVIGDNIYTQMNIDVIQEQIGSLHIHIFINNIINYINERMMVTPIVSLVAQPFIGNVDTPVPSYDILHTLPGQIFTSSVSISGNLINLNKMVEYIYFYAPYGTTVTDPAVLTITVYDNIPKCDSSSSTDVTLSYADLPKSTLDKITVLCNSQNRNTTTINTISFIVSGKNQPPIITITSAETILPLNITSNTQYHMNFIVISDPDFIDVPTLTTSFGLTQNPPVTVTVSTKYGTLILKNTDEINAFNDDVSEYESNYILYGPVDKVNEVLQYMYYECIVTIDSKCQKNVVDYLYIVVSDGGYIGEGGEMSASKIIDINIT